MSIEDRVATLIAKVRDESLRWQAIEVLKSSATKEMLPTLLRYLNDDNWVVRWLLADLLGRIKDPEAIKGLVQLLLDRDFHVEQAAYQSILNLGPSVSGKLVTYLSIPSFKIRKLIFELLIHFNNDALVYLYEVLPECDLISANRLIEIVSRFKSSAAKDFLVSALAFKSVQKSAIIYLGALKYKEAMPKLLELFLNPVLKKLVLEAMLQIDPDFSFELLVQELNSDSFNYRNYLELKILEIGEPLLPLLLKALKQPTNKRKFITDILAKMDLEKVSNELHELCQHDSDLCALTKEIRKKYPINLQKQMIKISKREHRVSRKV